MTTTDDAAEDTTGTAGKEYETSGEVGDVGIDSPPDIGDEKRHDGPERVQFPHVPEVAERGAPKPGFTKRIEHGTPTQLAVLSVMGSVTKQDDRDAGDDGESRRRIEDHLPVGRDAEPPDELG